MTHHNDRTPHRSSVLLPHALRFTRIIAAPSIALTLLSGCISEEDLRAAQRKAELMETRIQDLEANQKVEIERLIKELESIGAEKAEAESRARQAESELEGVMGDVQNLRDEFDKYKRKYRISFRSKAVGQTYDEIALEDGMLLKGVEIIEINPAGFRLKHEAGFTNVPYTSLPLELQEKYMFSADEAIAFANGTVDENGEPLAEEEEPLTVQASMEAHDPFADIDMSAIEAAAEVDQQKALAGRSQDEIKKRRLELRREISTLQMQATIQTDKIKRYNTIAGRGDGEAWTAKAKALAGPLKKIYADIELAEKKIEALNGALVE